MAFNDPQLVDGFGGHPIIAGGQENIYKSLHYTKYCKLFIPILDPPMTAQIACQVPRIGATVNHMVHCQERLDATFSALADATRRGVLEQLGRSDASITDLAQRFRMTRTGMKKHVSVLEQAGLVTTEKVGRVRTCRLGRHRLEEEAAWIERHRRLWSARFEALDELVEQLKRKEKADDPRKRR